jgi:hypothetical protein
MNTTRAIYIQGCARSGNTLMRELCVSGFQGGELVKLSKDQAECSLAHVVELLQQSTSKSGALVANVAKLFRQSPDVPRLLVASRNYENSLAMDRELLRAHPDVKVLWMLRDPRDVLSSMHPDQPGKFYVTPADWIQGLQLYNQFKDEPQVLTVRYEELVTNPDAIQARIAQSFNLVPSRSFVEAHKFFPRFFENVRAMHSIRPIDANSVQKWKNNPQIQQFLEQVFASHPEIVSMSRELGYEITATPS